MTMDVSGERLEGGSQPRARRQLPRPESPSRPASPKGRTETGGETQAIFRPSFDHHGREGGPARAARPAGQRMKVAR